MKRKFKNRLEAIDWIAGFSKDEAQFEVLREQLTFNHIYTGEFYLETEDSQPMKEVAWLENDKANQC